LGKAEIDSFIKDFMPLIKELQNLDPTQPADRIIDQILATAKKHLGTEGPPFVLGFFVSAIGLGSAAQDLYAEITSELAKYVTRYIIQTKKEGVCT